MTAYMYAVRSENSSHVQSLLSDTVTAVAQIDVPLETPRDLNTKVISGNVSLFWNEHYTDQPGCIA